MGPGANGFRTNNRGGQEAAIRSARLQDEQICSMV
jgi:hypothetical protein